MKFIARIILGGGALLVVAYIVPGITVHGIYPAIISALILGLLNAVVRPILIFLTLPITILTLGLFIFVINTGIFLFVASFVDGFEVTNWLSGLIGSLLMSVLSTFIYKSTKL